jgi:nicotinate-nucleotide--dimethylbenzimidazole phosphoribosyltransferase
VTASIPDELEAVVARINPALDEIAGTPVALTGELAVLLDWWQSVSDGSTPRVAKVGSPPVDDVADAMRSGVAAADREIDAGATLLVPRVSRRDEHAARTLVALLAYVEPQAVVPQRPGTSDTQWIADVTRLRDDVSRLSGDRGEPMALLEGVRGSDIAFVVGVLLAAAARRTPCIIDGTEECAAVVVADRLSNRARSWWLCGSQSPDPARAATLDRVGLAPGLPLALSDEDGWGAEATIALLRLVTDAPN